ncbi:hypothetical protein SAMD00019534_001820, partial [Acytostelium subglobosum LB1]|uniref:hypothetical protein n=1 Tax=Acytostelium subglobosum LB1 TaxID=1410327 RepID=UPI0006448517
RTMLSLFRSRSTTTALNVGRLYFSSSTPHTQIQTKTKTKLVTTPIFYVNGNPHIGHLYSALLADALSRWNRMCQYDTLFATGTDEHGMKVQEAAKKFGKQPLEFCNQVSSVFRDLFDKCNIKYDDYIRTTEPRHKEVVYDMWRRLDQRGLIYKGTYEGWYCTSDEAFLTDEQVHDGMSPITPTNPLSRPCKVSIESGNPVDWVSESNYMFKLTNFLPEIDTWLSKQPLYPASRNQQAKAYLPHLRDLSISRPSSRLSWGIPVPDDPSQTIYVWLDALTNYVTVAGGMKGRYWNDDVTHIIGKDIVKFHSIYWPAFLLGAGLALPSRIIAHAHWTVEREKMSKSRGNVIDPFKSIEQYGVEGIRYFLLKGGGLDNDGDWSNLEVRAKLTADLADSIGNLVSRTTAKALHPQRQWPTTQSTTFSRTAEENASRDIVEALKRLCDTVSKHYSAGDFKSGIFDIMTFTYATNLYIDTIKPWTLVPKPGKQAGDLLRLNDTMYILFECIRTIAMLLQPVIPEASQRTLDHLGIPLAHRTADNLVFGYQYQKNVSMLPTDPLILFKKD